MKSRLIKKCLLIILTLSFITILLTKNNNTFASTSSQIKITYQKDGNVVEKVTPYDEKLKSAYLMFVDFICNETLTSEINWADSLPNAVKVDADDKEWGIVIEKA